MARNHKRMNQTFFGVYHTIHLSFEGYIGWGSNLERYERKSRIFATYRD